MHVTEKTYYDLPYERELTVRVVDIITDGKHKAVVLDKTIFYPEGGGQPGDMGWLGTYEIIDTQKKNDGTIEHVLSEGYVPEIGKEYRLTLNWSHRYDFMQQHTAQHLISGILYSSASIGTVSVHFGKDLFTIETDADEIEPAVLLAVEDKVNEIIRTHVPLQVKTATREEADAMGLRREIKVDNDVRLVSIGSYDTIACGGLHVRNSSEIVHVLCIGTERIRNHVRIQWIAGARTVEAMRANHAIVKQLCAVFSSKDYELVPLAQSLQSQLTDARYHLRKAKVALAAVSLKEKLISSRQPVLAFECGDEEPEILRFYAEAAESFDDLALCLVQKRNDERLSWMMMVKGPCAAQFDFSFVRQQLLPIIEGKGGGRPPLWQGAGTKSDQISLFLQKFIELFSREDLA